MKYLKKAIYVVSGLPSLGLLLTASLLLAGCASTKGVGTSVTMSDASLMTRSGFLSDYERLKPVQWTEGLECWRDTGLHLSKYDKVLIGRMAVTLKPGQQNSIDPADLKEITDYFHDSLVEALKPQMPVVDQTGAGVVVIRIALTSLVPTDVSRSVAGTLIPYGFVAEASSGVATGRPAGSTPYLGETGMEMQFRDGVSGAILGECRDTEIGRKYAADLDAGAVNAAQTWASGYLNSFDSWAYARNALDKWSMLVAQRFASLRGVKP